MSICRPVTCFLFGLAAGASAETPPPAPAAPPAACAAPEHRQFDFWVGSWDVYPTGKPKLVAHSLIEKLYDGCAIRENWMPLQGSGGGSLNSYVVDQKKWRQTWVDSSNARVDFSGGMVGSSMVLTGFWKDVNGPGRSGLIRMTYSRDQAGAVRQLGEVSTDNGKTWGPSFDFAYRASKTST
jgi:hypothetical protein